VTGAAGFIGSAFVREALAKGDKVVIYDALTYAGHMPNIESCLKDGICEFVKADIRDYDSALAALQKHKITQIANFAAESTSTIAFTARNPFSKPTSWARSRCSKPRAPIGLR